MNSVLREARAERARPEIVLSWTRSRLNGLSEDGEPALRHEPRAGEGVFARTAAPVLEEGEAELDGTGLALVLADHRARVADIRCPDRSLRAALDACGVVPGVRLGEEQVGTNAVGTPLETRQGLLVDGTDHFLTAFRTFACYGHPVVHPITRRLEGVVALGGSSDAEHPLFPLLVRRVVRDIEERLQRRSTRSQRRLLAAFQEAAGSPRRTVLVVGPDVVLATPSALALLAPADHAAVQTCVAAMRAAGEVNHRLTLAGGRTLSLRGTPVDGADGMLVDLVPGPAARTVREGAGQVGGRPLLVVGEPGTGRTTQARQAAGADADVVDGADAVRQGEREWADGVARLLGRDGGPVIIENTQLLTGPAAALVAGRVRATRRRVVVTSTPGPHLDGTHAPLTAGCVSRRDLVPLRDRPHEIPALAQTMLAGTAGAAGLRFGAGTLRVLAAQPWPGNLVELRRVVGIAARTRQVGDIVPADLPASHRNVPAPTSPLRRAEREIVVAALDAAGGNRVEAARALGISRSTLYNRMRALRIP
ncbi:helix-turn-helix domain-containing protein [Streptomyces albidoflavus]|uniref:helix-turn-helix domain-containing protein n=1 Tax=Streptomyces albidoflavus TaxID=1886 RepID=UPI0033B4787F